MRAMVYRRWPRVWVVTTTEGDGLVFPTWASAMDWAWYAIGRSAAPVPRPCPCHAKVQAPANDDEGSEHDNEASWAALRAITDRAGNYRWFRR